MYCVYVDDMVEYQKWLEGGESLSFGCCCYAILLSWTRSLTFVSILLPNRHVREILSAHRKSTGKV